MNHAPDTALLFTSKDGKTTITVQLQSDTVWLSLMQMAQLFERDKSTISRHIKNIFADGELDEHSVVAKFATTAADGKSYQVDYYNLDAVISVGYRVKSQRGVQFRLWASEILKEYLKKGFCAYFDIAELNAIEEREMKMADFVAELDRILSSTGRKLLQNADSISHARMEEKVRREYRAYQAKTLAPVEQNYLDSINALQTLAKQQTRKS